MEEAYSVHAVKGAIATPCKETQVTTRARLHFGFFDPSGRGQRPFGSLGLGLTWPQTRLSISRAAVPSVAGEDAERAGAYLSAIASHFAIEDCFALSVEETIPRHAGLGSGTQLALAVGTAFAALEGLDLPPAKIAALLGRGRRSGIGIGTFAAGGVVLDAGPENGAPPKIVAQVPFPEAWRVLLIFDASARGLHGSGEADAFAKAPRFPDAEAANLRRRAEEIALPALQAGDFDRFCAEVGHLQMVMGDYFAPFQGAPLLSPKVTAAIDWLKAQGLSGVGQSSWGPTGFAFVPDADIGAHLLAQILAQVKANPAWNGLQFDLVSGCNKGALIKTC